MYYIVYTWQFFVTFLGWLSDPVKGQVTSNYRIERSVWNRLVFSYIHIRGCPPAREQWQMKVYMEPLT